MKVTIPTIVGLQHVIDNWWRVKARDGVWSFWHSTEGWLRPMASWRTPLHER
ncbi:MAG TPA: hypothetical protein VH593_25325 [Ktedonobacteraceae bacterium]